MEKDYKYVKIENRGKVTQKRLLATEELIRKVTFDLKRGQFQNLCPKMYNILREDELGEGESIGFQVTLLFDIFKGRVHIKKQRGKELYNISFYRRYPTEGKFTYRLTKEIKNIPFDEILNHFKFIIVGENQKIKTGNIYLLKNGLIGIIRKYYSNDKIGVSYDEYNTDIEDFITVEDIEELIREGQK